METLPESDSGDGSQKGSSGGDSDSDTLELLEEWNRGTWIMEQNSEDGCTLTWKGKCLAKEADSPLRGDLEKKGEPKESKTSVTDFGFNGDKEESLLYHDLGDMKALRDGKNCNEDDILMDDLICVEEYFRDENEKVEMLKDGQTLLKERIQNVSMGSAVSGEGIDSSTQGIQKGCPQNQAGPKGSVRTHLNSGDGKEISVICRNMNTGELEKGQKKKAYQNLKNLIVVADARLQSEKASKVSGVQECGKSESEIPQTLNVETQEEQLVSKPNREKQLMELPLPIQGKLKAMHKLLKSINLTKPWITPDMREEAKKELVHLQAIFDGTDSNWMECTKVSSLVARMRSAKKEFIAQRNKRGATLMEKEKEVCERQGNEQGGKSLQNTIEKTSDLEKITKSDVLSFDPISIERTSVVPTSGNCSEDSLILKQDAESLAQTSSLPSGVERHTPKASIKAVQKCKKEPEISSTSLPSSTVQKKINKASSEGLVRLIVSNIPQNVSSSVLEEAFQACFSDVSSKKPSDSSKSHQGCGYYTMQPRTAVILQTLLDQSQLNGTVLMVAHDNPKNEPLPTFVIPKNVYRMLVGAMRMKKLDLKLKASLRIRLTYSRDELLYLRFFSSDRPITRWCSGVPIQADVMTFKVNGCRIRKQHNSKTCPYYHNHVDRRRNPRFHFYKPVACQYVKPSGVWLTSRKCPFEDDCRYAHSDAEILYHPQTIETEICHCKVPACGMQHSHEKRFDPMLYKTVPCLLGFKDCKDISTCHFYHHGGDKRRNPSVKEYNPNLCAKLGECTEEDCLFCHNEVELDYHPLNYKKKKCEAMPGQCSKGKLCPNIHSYEIKSKSTTPPEGKPVQFLNIKKVDVSDEDKMEDRVVTDKEVEVVIRGEEEVKVIQQKKEGTLIIDLTEESEINTQQTPGAVTTIVTPSAAPEPSTTFTTPQSKLVMSKAANIIATSELDIPLVKVETIESISKTSTTTTPKSTTGTATLSKHVTTTVTPNPVITITTSTTCTPEPTSTTSKPATTSTANPVTHTTCKSTPIAVAPKMLRQLVVMPKSTTQLFTITPTISTTSPAAVKQTTTTVACKPGTFTTMHNLNKPITTISTTPKTCLTSTYITPKTEGKTEMKQSTDKTSTIVSLACEAPTQTVATTTQASMTSTAGLASCLFFKPKPKLVTSMTAHETTTNTQAFTSLPKTHTSAEPSIAGSTGRPIVVTVKRCEASNTSEKSNRINPDPSTETPTKKGQTACMLLNKSPSSPKVQATSQPLTFITFPLLNKTTPILYPMPSSPVGNVLLKQMPMEVPTSACVNKVAIMNAGSSSKNGSPTTALSLLDKTTSSLVGTCTPLSESSEKIPNLQETSCISTTLHPSVTPSADITNISTGLPPSFLGCSSTSTIPTTTVTTTTSPSSGPTTTTCKSLPTTTTTTAVTNSLPTNVTTPTLQPTTTAITKLLTTKPISTSVTTPKPIPTTKFLPATTKSVPTLKIASTKLQLTTTTTATKLQSVTTTTTPPASTASTVKPQPVPATTTDKHMLTSPTTTPTPLPTTTTAKSLPTSPTKVLPALPTTTITQSTPPTTTITQSILPTPTTTITTPLLTQSTNTTTAKPLSTQSATTKPLPKPSTTTKVLPTQLTTAKALSTPIMAAMIPKQTLSTTAKVLSTPPTTAKVLSTPPTTAKVLSTPPTTAKVLSTPPTTAKVLSTPPTTAKVLSTPPTTAKVLSTPPTATKALSAPIMAPMIPLQAPSTTAKALPTLITTTKPLSTQPATTKPLPVPSTTADRSLGKQSTIIIPSSTTTKTPSSTSSYKPVSVTTVKHLPTTTTTITKPLLTSNTTVPQLERSRTTKHVPVITTTVPLSTIPLPPTMSNLTSPTTKPQESSWKPLTTTSGTTLPIAPKPSSVCEEPKKREENEKVECEESWRKVCQSSSTQKNKNDNSVELLDDGCRTPIQLVPSTSAGKKIVIKFHSFNTEAPKEDEGSLKKEGQQQVNHVAAEELEVLSTKDKTRCDAKFSHDQGTTQTSSSTASAVNAKQESTRVSNKSKWITDKTVNKSKDLKHNECNRKDKTRCDAKFRHAQRTTKTSGSKPPRKDKTRHDTKFSHDRRTTKTAVNAKQESTRVSNKSKWIPVRTVNNSKDSKHNEPPSKKLRVKEIAPLQPQKMPTSGKRKAEDAGDIRNKRKKTKCDKVSGDSESPSKMESNKPWVVSSLESLHQLKEFLGPYSGQIGIILAHISQICEATHSRTIPNDDSKEKWGPLLQPDVQRILELAIRRLSTLLLSGRIPQEQMQSTRQAIREGQKLLQYVQGSSKEKYCIDLDIAALSKALVGKDTLYMKKVIDLIFQYHGKETKSLEAVNNIIIQICSEQLKISSLSQPKSLTKPSIQNSGAQNLQYSSFTNFSIETNVPAESSKIQMPSIASVAKEPQPQKASASMPKTDQKQYQPQKEMVSTRVPDINQDQAQEVSTPIIDLDKEPEPPQNSPANLQILLSLLPSPRASPQTTPVKNVSSLESTPRKDLSTAALEVPSSTASDLDLMPSCSNIRKDLPSATTEIPSNTAVVPSSKNRLEGECSEDRWREEQSVIKSREFSGNGRSRALAPLELPQSELETNKRPDSPEVEMVYSTLDGYTRNKPHGITGDAPTEGESSTTPTTQQTISSCSTTSQRSTQLSLSSVSITSVSASSDLPHEERHPSPNSVTVLEDGEEVDTLAVEDIVTLLQNFEELSSTEQECIQEYILKLRNSNPEFLEAVKKAMGDD